MKMHRFYWCRKRKPMSICVEKLNFLLEKYNLSRKDILNRVDIPKVAESSPKSIDYFLLKFKNARVCVDSKIYAIRIVDDFTAIAKNKVVTSVWYEGEDISFYEKLISFAKEIEESAIEKDTTILRKHITNETLKKDNYLTVYF